MRDICHETLPTVTVCSYHVTYAVHSKSSWVVRWVVRTYLYSKHLSVQLSIYLYLSVNLSVLICTSTQLWALICTIELSFEHLSVQCIWLFVLIAPISSKKFLGIQTNIECGFTLKRTRDMIRTYSQMHRTNQYSQICSIIWWVWPKG